MFEEQMKHQIPFLLVVVVFTMETAHQKKKTEEALLGRNHEFLHQRERVRKEGNEERKRKKQKKEKREKRDMVYKRKSKFSLSFRYIHSDIFYRTLAAFHIISSLKIKNKKLWKHFTL